MVLDEGHIWRDGALEKRAVVTADSGVAAAANAGSSAARVVAAAVAHVAAMSELGLQQRLGIWKYPHSRLNTDHICCAHVESHLPSFASYPQPQQPQQWPQQKPPRRSWAFSS